MMIFFLISRRQAATDLSVSLWVCFSFFLLLFLFFIERLNFLKIFYVNEQEDFPRWVINLRILGHFIRLRNGFSFYRILGGKNGRVGLIYLGQIRSDLSVPPWVCFSFFIFFLFIH